MKSVIAVVFALCLVGALGALTEQQKAKLKEYKDSCIAETGVDPIVVENAKNGNIAEGDEKLSCFAACMLKKIGIINADGNFSEEVARAKAPQDIPQEKVDELIIKCKDITGENECQKGGRLIRCFMDNKNFAILD